MSTLSRFIDAAEVDVARPFWRRQLERMIEARLGAAERQIARHLAWRMDDELAKLGLTDERIAVLRAADRGSTQQIRSDAIAGCRPSAGSRVLVDAWTRIHSALGLAEDRGTDRTGSINLPGLGTSVVIRSWGICATQLAVAVRTFHQIEERDRA